MLKSSTGMKALFWVRKTQVDDGSYTETVSVVKGGNVKKEQIEKTLKAILINKGFKLKNEGLTEFDVDWTAEKPVAKIEMVTA